MSQFGLAPVKMEGTLHIGEEYLEDDWPLPKMPPDFICNKVYFAGKMLNRSEYAKERIKWQKFYK